MNCVRTNKTKKNILETNMKAMQVAFIYTVLPHKIAFYFNISLLVYVDFVLFVEFMNLIYLPTMR